ncbi:MAG: alpha/beta hydrolase [Pseudomonadota bacterium]
MPRDWDDAYANMAHIPNGPEIAAAWPDQAQAFREKTRSKLDISYEAGQRQAFDLFFPETEPKGLIVFIHGGYWMRFGREDFSHLAQGAVQRGFAACVPSYTLAPDASIADITREMTAAVEHAASLVDGPIYLTGHSAGGHLAFRLICEDSGLSAPVLTRVAGVTGIGGVYDLRPLMLTELNDTLHVGEAEAGAESPVLLRPKVSVPITVWVGAAERPEFVRQSRVMAMMWDGLGAEVTLVEDEGRHHFDVIDGLLEAHSPLMATVLGDQEP